MEAQFIYEIQHGEAAIVFSALFCGAFLLGGLTVPVVLSLCEELVMFCSRRIRKRDRNGHRIHHDHLDDRLKTWTGD